MYFHQKLGAVLVLLFLIFSYVLSPAEAQQCVKPTIADNFLANHCTNLTYWSIYANTTDVLAAWLSSRFSLGMGTTAVSNICKTFMTGLFCATSMPPCFVDVPNKPAPGTLAAPPCYSACLLAVKNNCYPEGTTEYNTAIAAAQCSNTTLFIPDSPSNLAPYYGCCSSIPPYPELQGNGSVCLYAPPTTPPPTESPTPTATATITPPPPPPPPQTTSAASQYAVHSLAALLGVASLAVMMRD